MCAIKRVHSPPLDAKVDAAVIRFLLRLSGLVLVAGAFVAVIIDGTRTIAGGELSVMPTGDVLAQVMGAHFAQVQPFVRRLHPLLWDPVLVWLLHVPIWGVAGLVGGLLLQLTRPPPPLIGHGR